MIDLFIRESNWIEGIKRDPLPAEIDAHTQLLGLDQIEISDLVEFVSVVQPGAVLRDRPGLNVRVGNHYPPLGAPEIRTSLEAVLVEAHDGDAYWVHHAYETLHPFTDGNGRSGRAVWLWMMGGRAPLGFLHHWYYQSLEHQR